MDILLNYLVEPHKSQDREAFNVAKTLIARQESSFELYIQHVNGKEI